MSNVPEWLTDDHHAPLLRVDGLTKRYGGERAIDGATFSVLQGEILGVIGPNGAGKTTLMEAVVGLLAADRSASLAWRALPAARRRDVLFYLPDGVRPYQDQLTAEVISFFSGVYRRSAAEIDAVLTSLGLKSVLGKRAHALSKGYNRRLLLALGLLTPHELVLMDEPFDGFDLRQSRDIIGALRRHAEHVQPADGRPGKPRASALTSRLLRPYLRVWGKRSPHEATCPRIASGFDQGRIMSAVLRVLSRKLPDLNVPLAAGVFRARLLAGPCVRRLP